MLLPIRSVRPKFLALLLIEGGLIFSVLYSLARLTLAFTGNHDPSGVQFSVLATSAVFAGLLFLTHWANPADHAGMLREIVVFAVMSLVLGVMALAVLWTLSVDLRSIGALLPLEGAIAVPATVALWRWLTQRYNVLNASREGVLIVGAGETARDVCRWIANGHASEYAVLGFADEDDSRLGNLLAMGVRIQTDYEHLPRFALQRADRIIVALDEKRGCLPVRQLMELRLRGLEIEEATTFFERVSGKIAVETMLPSWLIYSDGFKTSALRSFLKRGADLVLSALLLVVTIPLMLLTALAILLESGTPILYRQQRLGRDGSEFGVLKFRSMRQDAEAKSGPTWAQRNDPRVTRIGRIIRKLRIDELPQLFNVFKGEMSFVGPRPERSHFVRQLEEKIPYYGLRLSARPGITGWAQVEYGYGSTDGDALEKLKYDLYYIKNSNLLFDLWIVLKTIQVVLLGSGAR